jgi:ABC-type polysaccharide/polyol phosphate export permease
VIVSYQQMLFHGHFDHWRGLLAAAATGLLAFAVGAFLFERLRDTLAEEV